MTVNWFAGSIDKIYCIFGRYFCTMMKNLQIIFAAVLLSVMGLSCSTDVDLYADYKDITIVYGLLDDAADTTFIKVTKAFLGPGNALVIAQNPDSSNYAEKLDVKLKGKKGNNDLPEITLDTITIHNKLAGDSVFYFPSQLLYYTTAALDPLATYQLVINRGDKEVTASTSMVEPFSVSYPTNRISFSATVPAQLRWGSAKNGKRYEVNLVFHYRELAPGSQDTINKTMNWYLGTSKSATLDGGEQLDVSYLGEEFYNRLGQELDDILNVKRWAGEVDVIVSAGGDQLSTFIDVNAPSNSIVQELPEYTNVENGYGIFSSRRNATKTYRLAVQSETKLVENFDWGFIINR